MQHHNPRVRDAKTMRHVERVRRSLVALARGQETDYQAMLAHYAYSRLLWRLGAHFKATPRAPGPALTGDLAMTMWLKSEARQPERLDLVGNDITSDALIPPWLITACGWASEADPMHYGVDGIEVTQTPQRPGAPWRLLVPAYLGGMTVPLTVWLHPRKKFEVPITFLPMASLLESEVAEEDGVKIAVLPKETFLADTFVALDAMCPKTRHEDIYDMYTMTQHVTLQGSLLTASLGGAYERQVTRIPEDGPTLLRAAFESDAVLNAGWSSTMRHLRRTQRALPLPLTMTALRSFFNKPLEHARLKRPYNQTWEPTLGGWQETSFE